MPPSGYAVMMARGTLVDKAPIRQIARALAPYLAAQLVVRALVVLLPSLAHLAQPQAADAPLVRSSTTMLRANASTTC